MTNPNSKGIEETAVNDYCYRIFPNDLNSKGTVFGGLIMATLDRIAHVVAERHSGRICVTASVDAMHFLAPAGRGENLIYKASINKAWRSSMEIGVKVLAEDAHTMDRTHILSAYFTFVALGENDKPTSVPEVTPKTKIQKRRYKEAELRRKYRLQIAEEKKKLRLEDAD